MTSSAPVADPEVAPRSSPLSLFVKIGFGVAVLAFGIAFVVSRWHSLQAALDRIRPGWVVLALAFAVVAQWSAALGFRAVLTAVARRLPFLDVARVYFVSQLGKYIPGSVWPIVAVSQMCRRYGMPTRAGAAAGVLTLLFSLIMGALVGIALTLVGAAGSAAGLWWLLLLVPVALAAVHPRVLVPTVDFCMRVLRRAPVPLKFAGSALRGSLGWPVVSWLLLGLQCWALVVGLGGGALSSLAPAVGGFALAYTAGTLFVPAPAGAGVREAVLALALTEVIKDGSPFNHDSVIVVVLLSRVLLAVLDFAQAGAFLLATRRQQVPAGSSK